MDNTNEELEELIQSTIEYIDSPEGQKEIQEGLERVRKLLQDEEDYKISNPLDLQKRITI